MAGLDVDAERLLEAIGAERVERRGRKALWACCPLPDHDDAEPSFELLDDPGEDRHAFWRCYGCHRGGGPVGLVRQALELGAREARELLAKLATGRVPLAELTPEVEVVVDDRLGPTTLPPSFCAEPLERWPTPLKRYAEGRGLTAAQVERWGIGYALGGKLAMRVVIPIRDEAGRLLSYTARTAVGDAARYLSASARRERRRRGAVFGRQHWPRPGAGRDRLLLCEGALDALACERAGAPHIAALDGSALAAPTAELLASWRRLVVLADVDPAGEGAVAELLAQRSLRARIERAQLPGGLDPADAWQRCPEALRAVAAPPRGGA